MNSAYSTAAYIPLIPLLGFLFQAIFGGAVMRTCGRDLGRKIMGSAAIFAVAIPFVIGVTMALALAAAPATSRSEIVYIAPWINLTSLNIPIEFLVDPLSLMMVLIVTGIGALIHLYATGYMSEERDYTRFFTYMNLFIAAMLLLVLANNLVLLFVGWEGVGLCSYLLIGFWYSDQANARAANKAFIVNRFGDFGFMLGTLLLFCLMVTHIGPFEKRFVSFDSMESLLPFIIKDAPGLATAAALLLFVGAAGKSAQFPLYSWLPDAMAGPTPVSALIHAATMVTSGIYLLNRMHFLFSMSPVAGVVISVIGAFTALFAALIAFGQTDIKKVLAYSTVSQLGYMFLACGAGGYEAGMFHVTTHAFFKALLFLGAGAVIHAMAHNQDMRNYGNLRKYLPVTFITMMIGFLAISGFPLLAGYWSKEAVLGAAIGNGKGVVRIAGLVALFTAFLTALYMGRLSFLTFFGTEERWRRLPHEHEAHPLDELPLPDLSEPDTHGFFYSDREVYERELRMSESGHHGLSADHEPHEVPLSMSIPLIALAIPSLVAGWLLARNNGLTNWLYPMGLLPQAGRTEVAWLPFASIAAALAGIALGYIIYQRGLPENEGWDLSKWNPLRKLAGEQFFYDKAITTLAVIGGGDIARGLNDGLDRYGVDGTISALAAGTQGAGLLLRKLQSGYVRFYAFVMLLGVLGMLGYFAMHLRGGF